jgi:hypothetical protein
MYKFFLPILVVVSQFTDIYGQTNSKWYLSIDKGATIPIGQFANKNYTNLRDPKTEINGLAQPGFQINLSGGYSFNPKVALHSQIGYSFNRQSANSYRDFFGSSLTPPFTVTVDKKSWKVFKAMVGIKARQSLNKNEAFFIEERLLAGISKTKEPGYSVGYVAGTFPQIQAGRFEQSTTNLPIAFAWLAGMGIGYNINSRFFVSVDMNYFDSRPRYHYTYVPPPYSSQSPIDSKLKYTLNSVGVTGSVGCRF